MTKKYYWLKLKVDFFQQRELKRLRKIAGGDTYTIIYLKILLLAIQQDKCVISYNVPNDKFAEELALDIDEDYENVEVTLRFLEANSLAEFIEGDMTLAKVGELVGSETDAASRMRKMRSKNQLKAENVTMLHDCYKNVTTEIRDKSIEYRDKSNTTTLSNNLNSSSGSKTVETVDISNLINSWCNNFHPITPHEAERLKSMVDDYGYENVSRAMKTACDNNRRTIAYVEGTAKNYSNGIDYNDKAKPTQKSNDLAGLMEKMKDRYGDGV